MKYDIICNRLGCNRIACAHIFDGQRYDGGYCSAHIDPTLDETETSYIDEDLAEAFESLCPETN